LPGIAEKSPQKPQSVTSSVTSSQKVTLGFLTPQEAAMALGVAKKTVLDWCKSGRLPAIPQTYGQRLSWMISPALVDCWLESLRSGLLTGRAFSPRTVDDYESYIRPFLEARHTLTVEGFKDELAAIPAEQFAKREHFFKASVCFARFLEQEQIAPAGMLAELKGYRPKRHQAPKRTTVNEAGLQKLFQACRTLRDRALLTLLVSTGLRASECCALRLADLDPSAGVVTVRIAKGGKTRRVGLPAQALETLLAYLEKSEINAPSAPIFRNRKGDAMDRQGLFQRVERIAKDAGVSASPHALRRAFVTLNALQGRPLPVLQRACGHSSIRTTEGYCRITEQEVIDAMKGW
jgi:excisionase family DNA binding protein